MRTLKDEVIHQLKIRNIEDCDLKTLAIFCNPNHTRGSDSEVRIELDKILTNMISEDLVKKHRSPKNRIVYTFLGYSEKRSKKHGLMKSKNSFLQNNLIQVGDGWENNMKEVD